MSIHAFDELSQFIRTLPFPIFLPLAVVIVIVIVTIAVIVVFVIVFIVALIAHVDFNAILITIRRWTHRIYATFDLVRKRQREN